MSTCGTGFVTVGESLDFHGCDGVNPFGYLRSPLHLQHPTMAVVEALLIVGAVLFVGLGVRRAVRDHDATLLCFLGASVVYLLVMEIPGAYFPDLLGANAADVPFVHNRFSVGLLYDRLPLYIVALYLALPGLAFVLVERAGIFARRHGVVAGAICVGAIHHALYEIFDHLGPQYHWWAWNRDLSYMALGSGSVPMTSLVGFSLLGPFVLTLAVVWIIRAVPGRRGAAVGLRVVAAGVVAAVALPVAMSPIFGLAMLATLGGGWTVVAAAGCYLVVAGFGATTIWVLRYREVLRDPVRSVHGGYAIGYLAVFAALWIYALPDYLDATAGQTRLGTPIGSLPYVLGCYVFIGYVLWRCLRRGASVDDAAASRQSAGAIPSA